MKEQIIKILKDGKKYGYNNEAVAGELLGLFMLNDSALLGKFIPLLISYFCPITPNINSGEMFKKRLQIIEILNSFKAD